MRFIDRFINGRRILIAAFQGLLVIATYYIAFALRLDFSVNAQARRAFLLSLPWVLVIKLVTFRAYGLLQGWWRYVGMSDLMDITKASLTSAALIYAALWVGLWPRLGYPRSVVLIDLILTIFCIGGARFLVRAYTETVQTCVAQKETLVVGAGVAGTTMMRELKQNPDLDYKPIGFVDDDLTKVGIRIHGKKVLGTTSDITALVEEHGVKCVLIAIPSAPGKKIDEIISKCSQCKVEFKILNGVGKRIDGEPRINQIRQVRLEDFLGREPVRLDLGNIQKKLEGESVLITGAGGSIGSELARQVSQFRPAKVVLLERSESDLFRLCCELRSKFPLLNHVPVVGDILDVGLLREVFAAHRPHSVFHAAAYKHVPMMETNCFQAVTNNIFGTYNVALVARQYEVKDFVLISTDKAVKPSNIMGASKRIAELIILGLQQQRTRFVAVRFGNVLGSNGSVLPIFEEQVRNGGPVTVTHREAKRYFMLIPEAVQLVLQASTMGQGGEIFILDMGEEVKIDDLARNMIRLAGFEPDKEIKIVYTGLRPGEKLSEELRLQGEGLAPTAHEKIRVLQCGKVDFLEMRAWLDELSTLVESRNVHGLVKTLRSLVPEYHPSAEILALCDVDRHDSITRYRRGRASLAAHLSDAAA
ncbi:MAG TPA: nucleoside-diphosphate sugar epimerase/dehydratase [Candidatus Angelobacter sp.]|nr:nucleoside-diphosphate sugar epimerase/dehydratase [Candidatus Angelobacter sp.]